MNTNMRHSTQEVARRDPHASPKTQRGKRKRGIEKKRKKEGKNEDYHYHAAHSTREVARRDSHMSQTTQDVREQEKKRGVKEEKRKKHKR